MGRGFSERRVGRRVGRAGRVLWGGGVFVSARLSGGGWMVMGCGVSDALLWDGCMRWGYD